nr:uncharacterized protein LOC117986036 isoform X4 [Maniola hyperantus]
MQNNDDNSSLNMIYKFRRKKDKPDVFINPASIGRFSEVQSHNILIEVDEKQRQKTYAILQEPRSDFHSNRLRYVLLIYTNPMWNLFILTTVFFAYFLETSLYTFSKPDERSFWLIMLVVFLNMVFTIDVTIVFGLKFFERWRMTLNLVEPDTKRVILDAVLALPYSFMYLMKPQEYIPFSYHAIAPVMATARVYRIIEYSYSKSSQAGTNQWTTFLAQYLILFLLSVHTWTCIWYLFAHKTFDIHEIRSSWSVATVKLPTETTFDWYFVGAYWSVLFFTTNAFGDIYPVNTYERITAAVAVLLGFLLTTVVFVGSLTSLFITITTRRAKYVRQLKKIQNHLSLIKMDPDTTKRIIRYYEDLWYQKSGVFKPKLMKLLPAPLQMEICYDLNAVPLYSSLIFRKLPEAFLRRLSVTMTHQFYLPGDIVYNHNQNKTIMIVKYCVYIGFICYWSGVILYMESCFVIRCSQNSWFARALTWEDQRSGMTSSKTKHHILTATYFATTTLLLVGYGDFTPGDHFDMGFIAFLSLYGVLLTGYCVSEFSAVVTHWSRTKTAFLEVIITIDRFMKENKMHPAIKSRIMSFYELQWQYNAGVELTGENWLEKTVVPSELRKKVLHQARFKTLTSIRFFQVKNKAYIHTLTETARDIILPPGEIVYYGGTVTRDLYIIESGYCLVTCKEMRETKRERVIGPGNHLGLLVLLYGVPAVSTVMTLTHCKLISISHFAYTSALNLFPDMREHDGLLLPEELKKIEQIAKSQNTDAYLKHYNVLTDKQNKKKITNILQDFLNDSFINVLEDYRKKKENYVKSYKQFNVFSNLSPYLLMPIAIKPDGVFLKTWAILRVCAAYLLSLLIPIVIATAPTCNRFNIPVVFLECFCYADLYLMLHVAYYGPKNQLIYHPYLTARNYLRRTFIVDLLTCFPWYAVWKLFIPKHDEYHTPEDHQINIHMYHCIIRMVNVLQIYKLYAAFWAESIAALKRAYLMSVVQFFLLTLFFLNLYTSILITMTCRYVFAYDYDDFAKKLDKLSLAGPYMKTTYNLRGNMICKEGSWIDGRKIFTDNYLTPSKVYLLAYYWSATSFTGAGFGDITAQDTAHMILSICINIHGVLFFGYVYARIASLKAMADQVVTTFQENFKHLELFLNREKVPYLLKKSVLEYWKYQWKRTGGWSHQKILGKLHANLNEDAVLYMYENTLREIPLFEDMEYSFFRAFAKKLKERYFQKGYMVMRSNEVTSNMYIIYRGKVDIISNINEVEACMGPGGIFGNIRGTSKYLTMSNVVASRNIDLLNIDGAEFYALLKSYPTVLRKVKYSVDSTTKDYVLPTVMSEKSSMELESYPLTYKADEDEEEEADPNLFLDSPDKSVAESHGSRSITSGDYADYISAAWLLFQPHRWFRSSVVPDSNWLTFIDYLIMVLSYVDFMILVYQMAFLSNAYFFHMCLVFDVIFLYKAFLDIHSGYMNRYGDYVLKPRKVRQMYFSKVYLRRRDFLANLPISYLAFAMSLRPSVQHALFCYLRTPQLFRISYLFTYRQHRKINIGSANLFLKLTTIAIWASLLTHVNACLFFKLSCLTPVQCTSANWISKEELNLRGNYAEKNFFPLYIASLWYMFNLLTITGTGDVSSQNDFEVIETVFITIVIKFCTGLLISEMSAMITAHSSSRIAYDYGINELRDGLRDTDLSDHQMNKMWDYVRELWNRQQGKQMPKLVYKLPFQLRCQVMQAVYGSHIHESLIFRKADNDFKRMLSMWLKHCVFFPGNYIVQCGDADQSIYFIHRGEVEVLTVHQNLTESIYDILGPEDSFGVAQGLFVGVTHHFSFRARTIVDIVYLKLDEWKYLLDFYPSSAKIVQRKVENVYLAI